MPPAVSFVVPCYNLAHLLGECVESILAQTYNDFEILVMDDCSPDNTPDTVAQFDDARLRCVRNEQNLGHLRNYNKGIGLSLGRFVWLISADDTLRSPRVLERYMRLMDAHPEAGYVCCPGVRTEDGKDTAVEGSITNHDTVFDGRDFLVRLLAGNFIAAASGMVRRSCYEKCGAFPPDLPYAGDWFLWCLFALHFDVAYCAEPMVTYRGHDLSMTHYLMAHRPARTFREGFLVLGRIRKEAEQIGDSAIVEECSRRLGRLYGMHITGWDCGGWKYCMSEEDLEESLADQEFSAEAGRRIRAITWMTAGDYSLQHRNVTAAADYYSRASRCDCGLVGLYARRLLVRSGGFGVGLALKGRAAWKSLAAAGVAPLGERRAQR